MPDVDPKVDCEEATAMKAEATVIVKTKEHLGEKRQAGFVPATKSTGATTTARLKTWRCPS